jgi:hypothetical protein
LSRHTADGVLEKNVVRLALAQNHWRLGGVEIAVYQELPVRQFLCGKMVWPILFIGDSLVIHMDSVDETEAPIDFVEAPFPLFKSRLAIFCNRTGQFELSRAEQAVHHCANAIAVLPPDVNFPVHNEAGDNLPRVPVLHARLFGIHLEIGVGDNLL